MALKMKIGQSVYDGLPDDVKKEYKKEGSDYVLDLDGYEDPEALRNARDHEKRAAADAKRDLAAAKQAQVTAEAKVRDLEAAGAKVDEAVTAKDKEWQAKYDKDIGEKDTKLTGLTNATITQHRNAIAETLANKISTAPSLLAPRLAERILVEIDPATNTPKATILDEKGNKTAGTVADLEKAALANKDWSPILRGTKATGGGGAPPSPGGGGAPRSDIPPRPGAPQNNLATMAPADLAAMIREQKEQGA